MMNTTRLDHHLPRARFAAFLVLWALPGAVACGSSDPESAQSADGAGTAMSNTQPPSTPGEQAEMSPTPVTPGTGAATTPQGGGVSPDPTVGAPPATSPNPQPSNTAVAPGNPEPGMPAEPMPMPAPGEPAMASEGDDVFTISASLSENISTVGVVEWSASVPVDGGYIEFGREGGDYEFQAPISDVESEQHRGLLLGMKEDSTYVARLVVTSGDMTYTSGTFTVTTGFLANSVPRIDVEDFDAAALYGGFTLTCTGFSNAASSGFNPGNSSSSFAFIFDADGDVVWAYDIGGSEVAACSSTRFSFDGNALWIGNFSNVATDGMLMRITLDGQVLDTYPLPARHHHFAVLPNGHILYQEQVNGGGYSAVDTGMEEEGGLGGPGGGIPGGGFGMASGEGADRLMELDPETGQSTELYDQTRDFQQQIEESGAHTNYVTFVPELNAISFSMRHTSTIGLISYPDAELLAVFGGPEQVNMFGINWDYQHGHEFEDGRLLIFNNDGQSGNSDILEYEFDLNSSSATAGQTYAGTATSVAFGDVQRLPNGNTFVTYSTAGVWDEYDASHRLLRQLVASEPIGYSRHRMSLYGAPPPWSD